MNRSRHIPRHSLDDSPLTGMFVKRLGVDGGTVIKSYPHRDDYYMIVVISKGRAEVAVVFDLVTLSAGEALIVSPSQVHSPSPVDDIVEGWLLAVASEHLSEEEICLAEQYALRPSPVSLSGQTVAELESLFGMILNHINERSVALSLVSAVKSIIFSRITFGRKNAMSRYMAIALRFKALINANLKDEKRPSRYADMMNISEVYLNEAIKAATGLSAGGFIRCHVVLQAKRHLVYTALSAQEIAFDLGYDDYTYFYKVFKKETGMSPVQYRKNLK